MLSAEFVDDDDAGRMFLRQQARQLAARDQGSADTPRRQERDAMRK